MKKQGKIVLFHLTKRNCSCVCVFLLSNSTQYGTTFVKKLIEDNCTMDETVRFFAVTI